MDQDLDLRKVRALTSRERQVLEFVAEGMGNAAIAQHLIITERTVKSHIVNLRRKLHARDRTHLVAQAFRVGLLSVNCP